MIVNERVGGRENNDEIPLWLYIFHLDRYDRVAGAMP